MCKYCGQIVEVDPCTSRTEAAAQERVNRLFGEGAGGLGFKPVDGEGVIGVLERLVELIARSSISTAAINVRGQCIAKFSVTSKGKIKVGRSETRSCNLEAGE